MYRNNGRNVNLVSMLNQPDPSYTDLPDDSYLNDLGQFTFQFDDPDASAAQASWNDSQPLVFSDNLDFLDSQQPGNNFTLNDTNNGVVAQDTTFDGGLLGDLPQGPANFTYDLTNGSEQIAAHSALASERTSTTPGMQTGVKRSIEEVDDNDDASKRAAAEDKRRRNTEASAKHRSKKKRIEFEMKERLEKAEARVAEVEKERREERDKFETQISEKTQRISQLEKMIFELAKSKESTDKARLVVEEAQ